MELYKRAYLLAEEGEEIWEPIPDHPDYHVSNLGRVKSFKYKKPKVVRPNIAPTGHHAHKLYKDGILHTFPTHRLVLIAFAEPSELYVLHLDDNPHNNSITNLMYGTQQVNIDLCIDHGRKPVGDECSYSTISEATAKTIIALYSSGLTREEVAIKLDVSISIVIHIVCGKTWAHLDKSSIQTRPNVRRIRSKLSPEDVREIRQLRANGEQAKVLEQRWGLASGQVTRICKKQIYSWVE